LQRRKVPWRWPGRKGGAASCAAAEFDGGTLAGAAVT